MDKKWDVKAPSGNLESSLCEDFFTYVLCFFFSTLTGTLRSHNIHQPRNSTSLNLQEKLWKLGPRREEMKLRCCIWTYSLGKQSIHTFHISLACTIWNVATPLSLSPPLLLWMWRRKRLWNHKISLSLSLSLFHNLRTNTTRGTRLPRFSPPHPHPSLTSGFCFLIADCHWRHFFRKTLEVVESSSGEKSKILYNDTTTWIRSKCMHCRICPTNPTL